ncbi:zinc finger protein [Theobroma cacao]|nr:zinc finger protein [Theobroma cacao]
MLYQTHHHPFFFHFRSFTSIPPPLPSTTPSLLPSSLQEMECVEAALKTSFRKEMALKSSPQAFLEDIWLANGQNGVSSDDFSVDDLFDFTNEEGFLEQQQQPQHEEEEEEEDEGAPISSSSSSPKRQKLSQEEHLSNDTTTNFDYGSLPTSELAVPADDVANLEWLSHFVEDSFSEHSTAYPTGTLTENPKLQADILAEPEKPVITTCFKTPVPAKARSKRARTGGRVWSLVASPSLTESSSSSTSSSSSSSPSSPWLLYPNSASGSTFEPSEPLSVEKPPAKKHKKRPATDSTGGNGTQPTRRCSHCGVTKTPQWRAGPMGAKTLCNACGVRFKSGRLLPEYRPACSPTFSSELHSNHHRKVLEMRRKKETLGPAGPGLAPPVVPSFG